MASIADLKRLHENRVGLPIIKDKIAKSSNFEEIKSSVTVLIAEVDNHLQELKILSEDYGRQIAFNTPRIDASVKSIEEIKISLERNKKEIDEKIRQFEESFTTQIDEISEVMVDSTKQFVKYSEFKSLRTAAIAILMAIGGQVISKALAGLL